MKKATINLGSKIAVITMAEGFWTPERELAYKWFQDVAKFNPETLNIDIPVVPEKHLNAFQGGHVEPFIFEIEFFLNKKKCNFVLDSKEVNILLSEIKVLKELHTEWFPDVRQRFDDWFLA